MPTSNQDSLVRPDLQGYCPASNLKLNEEIHSRMAKGETIYHFGFGQSPFPVIEKGVKALQKNAYQAQYLQVKGIPELRQSIVDFHREIEPTQKEFNFDDVIVGPGSKELIFLAMRVFNGAIMVMSPSWTTYAPQARLAGHNPIIIDTNFESEWRLTPAQVESALKTCDPETNKLLVLCNPCNPTGTTYTSAHLIALAETFKKYNITVISDEIYAHVSYSRDHLSLASFYPEATIVSSGLSKWASAGGWRVGYAIFPTNLKSLRDAVASAASHTYSCCSAPMQYAAIEILTPDQDTKDYITYTSMIMGAVGDFAYRTLIDVGVKIVRPKAGFYMFPDFEIIRGALKKRGVETGQEMCKLLFEETGICIMSGGPAFLRPLTELTARLCFVHFDGSDALVHARQNPNVALNDDFVKKHAKNVYDGISLLANWVAKLKKNEVV